MKSIFFCQQVLPNGAEICVKGEKPISDATIKYLSDAVESHVNHLKKSMLSTTSEPIIIKLTFNIKVAENAPVVNKPNRPKIIHPL